MSLVLRAVRNCQKARSFDSLDRASNQDSVSVLHTDPSNMSNRRSSGLSRTDSAKSKESSPEVGKALLGRKASSSSFKRESSPNVTFMFADDSSSITDSLPGGSGLQKTPSRKSTDSSDSQKGGEGRDGSIDLGEKSFESSLNMILNKCSETSLEVISDGREDGKKSGSDRKKKSTPWYSMLSPTYKSRSEDFKRQFKEIPPDERLICDYSCALQKEILVHGRMFVTQNWICFYANIFRWETIVTIPIKDVSALTKEKTARVIPNALQVTTDREKYFFTSFTARDKTFLMLFRLWQNALMEQPLPPQEMWNWVHSCYGDDLGLTSSDDDYVPPLSNSEGKDFLSIKSANTSKGDSSELLGTSELGADMDDGDSTQADLSLEDSCSAPLLSGSPEDPEEQQPTDLSDTTEDDMSEGEIVCSEHDHLSKLAHNEVYHIPVDTMFELLFTDCEFFRAFISARKYTDVTLSPWRDEQGENIGRVREANYIIPLNAPFGPKTSNTIEKHMCYKQSQPGVMYLIDAECTPLGIPYSDAFYVMNRYCLTRVSKGKCRLRVTSEVKYRKSLWGVVKNMIERNSVQGVLDYFQCLGIHLRKESEKHQKNQGLPLASKRKLRKRRSHGVRGTLTPGDISSTSRQMSRSQADKMAPPAAPSRTLSVQKEEKLLNLNADTLVRIVCCILVLLVMFNALLFYKLWSLETAANLLYFPDSGATFSSLHKHPPQSQEEWVRLLQQQQHLHEAEMHKWQDLLAASISMVDQMKQTLVNLKEHVALSVSAFPSSDPSMSSEATSEE
ncbi:protein Aster-B-like isoform X2 [Mya arenaria]|uniref:protein Aster-B-like isoform X2 n=1 Tax=Mya arenaria TaxID=6604 RepID=UPI0022E97BF7|nr:protein Aster-B-like isoform X2 [Mya arenaria]